ncbi:MAG TPA: TIGR03086 family metal-binding protein [Pseudonocardiaceae bacterium]
MSEVSERYTTIADGLTARIEGVTPDRWLAPTPCSEWTARDLVVHVVGTHRRVMATLDGTEPVDVDPDDDLPKQWLVASGEVREALSDEARASKIVKARGGGSEQSFESLVGRLLCADTLLHTWDLARATGQDERLDPAAVSKSMEFLVPLDEAIRRPGGFAAKIAPTPDADEQTRLLNFCGRAT